MLSLSMLLFIIALIGAAQEKSASGMGSLVEYGLTFTGWLYVMTWIGAVVVSVLTLIGTKKSAPAPASFGTGSGNYGFGL